MGNNQENIEISEKTPLREIIFLGPEAMEILLESGLHCLGCPFSMQESLEDGCLAHGMTREEIREIIDKLNSLENRK